MLRVETRILAKMGGGSTIYLRVVSLRMCIINCALALTASGKFAKPTAPVPLNMSRCLAAHSIVTGRAGNIMDIWT